MDLNLKSIFEKSIDRPIEGVIKADDEESILIELEEYVITNEIEQELMRRYIAVYERLSGNSYVLPKNDIKEDIISYINEKMKV